MVEPGRQVGEAVADSRDAHRSGYSLSDMLDRVLREGREIEPMLEKPSRTFLSIQREEARRRLQQRNDAAKEIPLLDRIRTGEDLANAEELEKKWRAYNTDLLARMFTTDEYANEYAPIRVLVHQPADNYNDPSLNTFIWRLNESVRRQVAKLESIIERLELIDEASADQPEIAASQQRSKVFVVHGHDEGAREGVARFLEKIGLEAMILREQPNQGRTIIEKFEACAREVGFVVVLLTADDPAAEAENQMARARQNVIFELGYFVGSLGRGRACLLRKGDVEIPSDLYGVVYTEMDGADGWKLQLARELTAAGFKVDANKVLA
jgi:predicted nucleotide-binding protein